MTASEERTRAGAPPAVRPPTDAELASVVDLHLEHLPHGLFPRLGRGFMLRWHRSFLTTGHGVALVAVDGERVVGFLAGATRQRAHVRTVLAQDKVGFALAGLAALAVRPLVAAHFLRTRARSYLRRLTRTRPRPSSAPVAEVQVPRDVAVVTALVVDPAARGLGVGSLLVDAFAARCADAGVSRAELVTLEGPDGAAAFYERLGWDAVSTHVNRDGHRCTKMVLGLPVAATVGEAAGQVAGPQSA